MRYVRQVLGIEPQGVGSDGNGDGPSVREYGWYEDHLVMVNLTTDECLDETETKEDHAARVVPYFTKGLPVPATWRSQIRIKVNPYGGAMLE